MRARTRGSTGVYVTLALAGARAEAVKRQRNQVAEQLERQQIEHLSAQKFAGRGQHQGLRGPSGQTG